MASIQTRSKILIWELLKQLSSVSFTAQSANGGTGWNGSGDGDVSVVIVSRNTIISSETGKWTTKSGVEMAFSNRYRWSLLPEKNSLKLEHLRYGDENPVKLLALYWASGLHWKTTAPHTCNDDTYTLDITCAKKRLWMNWTITGPRKNESILYQYQ